MNMHSELMADKESLAALCYIQSNLACILFVLLFLLLFFACHCNNLC